jgi:hypothetical protein
VLRIPVTDLNGRALTLYLKRTWKSYKKDGLFSLLQHGRVWSISRCEWENSKRLAELIVYFANAGFRFIKDFARTHLIHTLHVAVFEREGAAKRNNLHR